MNKINIAIDGYSSCGKSTTAKALAKMLNYKFIDTGAMYRSVTLFALNKNIISESFELDTPKLISELKNIQIDFVYNPSKEKSDAYLNGQNVEEEIRKPKVSEFVSHISIVKEVRKKLVAIQQEIGKGKGVVMDGRDIGSVVFPNAELKIFMTADPMVRAKRRKLEMESKGQQITLEEVLGNLKERDHIDSTRKESPLIQVNDAKVLDNSNLSEQEQLSIVMNWVNEIFESKKRFHPRSL